MSTILKGSVIAALLLAAAPAIAQDEEVPYWASIRSEVVNMRVGPAVTYRIDWVYRREGLPMKVIRREEGWRLVQDPDGAQGWVLGRFLSRTRTAIVQGDDVAGMYAGEKGTGGVVWRLEPGVVVVLDDCDSGWCRVKLNERAGFIAQKHLWGTGEP